MSGCAGKMWCAVLFCALVGSVAGQSWLTNITDNLRDGLSRVLETSVVNYSTPVINATYVARVEFDMRAMGHLYNSSHIILDIISRKQAYPEDSYWLRPVATLPLRYPFFIVLALIIPQQSSRALNRRNEKLTKAKCPKYETKPRILKSEMCSILSHFQCARPALRSTADAFLTST
ncbi:unnamed protein product [Colias eurytheme]|nr:unnamed protein product [Colias eurytheme]